MTRRALFDFSSSAKISSRSRASAERQAESERPATLRHSRKKRGKDWKKTISSRRRFQMLKEDRLGRGATRVSWIPTWFQGRGTWLDATLVEPERSSEGKAVREGACKCFGKRSVATAAAAARPCRLCGVFGPVSASSAAVEPRRARRETYRQPCCRVGGGGEKNVVESFGCLLIDGRRRRESGEREGGERKVWSESRGSIDDDDEKTSPHFLPPTLASLPSEGFFLLLSRSLASFPSSSPRPLFSFSPRAPVSRQGSQRPGTRRIGRVFRSRPRKKEEDRRCMRR